jgi:hypothetical protein
MSLLGVLDLFRFMLCYLLALDLLYVVSLVFLHLEAQAPGCARQLSGNTWQLPGHLHCIGAFLGGMEWGFAPGWYIVGGEFNCILLGFALGFCIVLVCQGFPLET